MRCSTSGRLTPAAATLTSTSPGPGCGTGRSTRRSASGPPGAAISMAFIFWGMVTGGLIDRRTLRVNAAAAMDEDDFFTSKPQDPLTLVTKQDLGPLSLA